VEVKSQPRFSVSMLAGLRAIGELPRVVRRVLVYTGPRSLRTAEGIEVWPADTFAANVASGRLWP